MIADIILTSHRIIFLINNSSNENHFISHQQIVKYEHIEQIIRRNYYVTLDLQSKEFSGSQSNQENENKSIGIGSWIGRNKTKNNLQIICSFPQRQEAKNFYSFLQETHLKGVWKTIINHNENNNNNNENRNNQNSNIDNNNNEDKANHNNLKIENQFSKRVGIGGLINRENFRQKENKNIINNSFSDLETLINSAKQMIKIAETLKFQLINEKKQFQSEKETKENEHFVTELRHMLASMGEINHVTKQSGEGQLFFTRLAKQTAELLTPTVNRIGTLTVMDAYCFINRARGVDLLTPNDFIIACEQLEKIKADIHLYKFSSGVMVLRKNTENDEKIANRIKEIIIKNGPLTIFEGSQILKVPVCLAKEYFLLAEKKMFLCRDESLELRFYYNFFLYPKIVEKSKTKNTPIQKKTKKKKKKKKKNLNKKTFHTENFKVPNDEERQQRKRKQSQDLDNVLKKSRNLKKKEKMINID
ncbi:vacuolar protein-sorting-associated protein [Anaeramoeba flamelloides]|uniref:Vacuolar protein-sorting-associated protein 36 n=1 Tax=Anaeramoeba flamelloides TaxID=1746091 RepID=A0ABQ8Z8U3_9EUKA|nr:vacuolar protein-sorting-associated protein [Anaeramoeba flamelloides]